MATEPPVITVEKYCYSTVGGDYCFFPGDPEIPSWEAEVQWLCDQYATTTTFPLTGLRGGTGTVPSDCPIPSYTIWVEVPNPNYVGTTTTVPQECFQLVGGNYCYDVGSPEWAEAVAEGETVVPTTTVPPTTVPPTAPPGTTVYSPAERGEQAPVHEVAEVIQVVDTVVEVPTTIAPYQQLPETGTVVDGLLLAGLACVALGSWFNRLRHHPDE